MRTQRPREGIQVWFMDEARARRGAMATAGGPSASVRRGLADKRFVSTYLSTPSCGRPPDDAFALVLPEVNANTMDIFRRKCDGSLVRIHGDQR